MAELRRAEQDIVEMQRLYVTMRHGNNLGDRLPPLSSSWVGQLESSQGNDPPSEQSDHKEALSGNKNENESSSPTLSSEQLLTSLEQVRTKLDQLEATTAKFRKRMAEKDPVTDKPRYGEKTLQRVVALLEAYAEFQDVLRVVFEDEDNSNDNDCSKEDGTSARAAANTGEESSSSVVAELRVRVARQQAKDEEEARQAQLAEEKRQRRQEQERLAKLEQERRAVEEAAALEERQRAERAAQVQQAMEAQRQAEEAQRRTDEEWVRGITVGPDGVRQQLQTLLQSTASDVAAQRVALTALQQLFGQIVAHPEEPKFRRIRRNHERFNQDIGRHEGGKELLIAAGFTLGAIDDVPSFISVEPNIEKDMDAWSQWFDLLKATLEVIQEHL